MDKTWQVISVVILLVFGVLFLKEGITGMSVFDWKDSCNSVNDCTDGKACCRFYGENTGVCDMEESCDFIYGMSKKSKEMVGTAPILETPGYIQEEGPDYIAMVVGLVLLFLGVIYYIRVFRGKNVKKIVNKGKKKKKKR